MQRLIQDQTTIYRHAGCTLAGSAMFSLINTLYQSDKHVHTCEPSSLNPQIAPSFAISKVGLFT